LLFFSFLGRSAVAEYLQVLTGGDSKSKKVNLRGQVHPAIASSITIIKEKFEKICLRDQDILGDPQKWNKAKCAFIVNTNILFK